MRIGILFLKLSVLYFLVGTGMGLTMEILQDHTLSGATVMAKLHFWLYNISLPLFMLGLSFMLYGNESLTILLAIFPNILVLSVLIFVLNVFLDVKPENLNKFNHKK